MSSNFSKWLFAVGGALFVLLVSLLWLAFGDDGETAAEKHPSGARKDQPVEIQSKRPSISPKRTLDDGIARQEAEESAAEEGLRMRKKQDQEEEAWMKSLGMENEGTNLGDAEMRAISATMTQFKQLHGEWPQGGNGDVASALLGRNPGEQALLNWRQNRLNQKGELLDRWGEPYLIRVDDEKVEILSAGPDRIFWNSDDLNVQ